MNETNLTPEEREDFWLEVGPRSAYTGLDAYETATKNGDVSPDGALLGWPGAEPGQDPAENMAPPDDLPEDLTEEELAALDSLDDVPPIDR